MPKVNPTPDYVATCQHCGHQETWPHADQAQGAAVWHVYEQHRDVWLSIIGDRPPAGSDPRRALGR